MQAISQTHTTKSPPREPPYTLARRTCAELMAHGGQGNDIDKDKDGDAACKVPVRVNLQAADTLRSSLDLAAIQKFGASLAQDANFTSMAGDFPTPLCEATWIVLTHAVDFGSGWRRELHQHHQKGAWLTIKPGVEALFQLAQQEKATHLPSDWLQKLTQQRVAVAFGIHDNPNLDLLAQYLMEVLKDLGRGSQEYGSLQELVTKTLQEISSSATPAGDFVWMLVDRFPKTFNDRYIVDIDKTQKQEVCFFKKAQLVTGEIYHRFRDENKDFRFVDGDNLTAFIDNVIVASLRYKKVIIPSQALTNTIENGQEIPMGSMEEVALRAAALCGVDAVVQGTCLSSCEFGNYLWAGLGKLPEVRKFARHATKTLFY